MQTPSLWNLTGFAVLPTVAKMFSQTKMLETEIDYRSVYSCCRLFQNIVNFLHHFYAMFSPKKTSGRGPVPGRIRPLSSRLDAYKWGRTACLLQNRWQNYMKLILPWFSFEVIASKSSNCRVLVKKRNPPRCHQPSVPNCLRPRHCSPQKEAPSVDQQLGLAKKIQRPHGRGDKCSQHKDPIQTRKSDATFIKGCGRQLKRTLLCRLSFLVTRCN